MSTLRIDNITNRPGTGAPLFPNGLTTNSILDSTGYSYTRILNIYEYQDNTTYETASTTAVVLEPEVSYTPVRSDSKLIVLATIRAFVTQTGGDNDARGAVTLAYVKDGTPFLITTTSINLGILNGGTDVVGYSMIPVLDVVSATSTVMSTDGTVKIAAYGLATADTTAGQITTLSVANRKYVIIEVI